MPGNPGPKAAQIIEQMLDYATANPSDNIEDNFDRIRDLLHIHHAAQYVAFPLGLATINQAGPGKASYRDIHEHVGLEVGTVRKYTNIGQRILRGDPS
jgi:hypothetical protein